MGLVKELELQGPVVWGRGNNKKSSQMPVDFEAGLK
jgi:hypothetical protein